MCSGPLLSSKAEPKQQTPVVRLISSAALDWPCEHGAVIITGAPGAGKSSVAEGLATRFEIAGVEFGALESEQLGWGLPWLASELVVRQLSAVLDLQRQFGRTMFLIVATTETSEELVAVLEAIGADRVATVLLTASPDVVAPRIDDREPDGWPGKQRLIAYARQLAASMQELTGVDVRVPTDDRTADDVAADVFSALQTLGILP
jgi:broad-specificity NMP kinase